MGKVKGFKVKLNFKKNAIPKFMKARLISYALKESVVAVISFWASPIVIATRPDGCIRMCSDFKSTVTPMLQNEEYPMPAADKLFNRMQGGQQFSRS